MKVHYRSRALFDLEEIFQYISAVQAEPATSLPQFATQSPKLRNTP
jgi:hypothetical protein